MTTQIIRPLTPGAPAIHVILDREDAPTPELMADEVKERLIAILEQRRARDPEDVWLAAIEGALVAGTYDAAEHCLGVLEVNGALPHDMQEHK